MVIDWNFVLSIGTIGVAILALWQTHKQIKLSNKQHLFDTRVENYLIVEGLIQLYRENEYLFNDEKDETIFSSDLYFKYLTNNLYLEGIKNLIKAEKGSLEHRELLKKLEELKEIALKIELIFYGKKVILLKNFILAYKELLLVLYKYTLIVTKMENLCDDAPITEEKAQKKLGEPKYRQELQEAFENIKNIDEELKKAGIEKIIKKQISIK